MNIDVCNKVYLMIIEMFDIEEVWKFVLNFL